MTTMQTQRIGFIGGGNMAAALMAGLLGDAGVDPSLVRCSEPSEQRRKQLTDELKVACESDNSALVAWAECVVLAVKPQVVDRALSGCADALAGKLLISVCAGIPIARLESLTGTGTRIVRAMPNTPALVGQGATAVAGAPAVTAEDLAFTQDLFEAVGRCWVVGEEQLDAVTGLSGSGPAYVMLFIEALADGGVRAGLPRQVAQQLAIQTVLGSASLAARPGAHPAQLKDMVTSPAGTTIEGVSVLERGGFRSATMDAVVAATERSRLLGK